MDKPKCYIVVKQGPRGRWRWVARSLEARTVQRITFRPKQGIAMGVGPGFEEFADASSVGTAAMRGWMVVGIEREAYKESE